MNCTALVPQPLPDFISQPADPANPVMTAPAYPSAAVPPLSRPHPTTHTAPPPSSLQLPIPATTDLNLPPPPSYLQQAPSPDPIPLPPHKHIARYRSFLPIMTAAPPPTTEADPSVLPGPLLATQAAHLTLQDQTSQDDPPYPSGFAPHHLLHKRLRAASPKSPPRSP